MFMWIDFFYNVNYVRLTSDPLRLAGLYAFKKINNRLIVYVVISMFQSTQTGTGGKAPDFEIVSILL